MLPEHVNIILLSATVPNTKEFADWVGYEALSISGMLILNINLDERRRKTSMSYLLQSDLFHWNITYTPVENCGK
jgi:hypothetical protein